MRKKLWLLVLLLVLGLPVSTKAATKMNLDEVQQSCYCVSKTDTNQKKQSKYLKKSYNQLYKQGKVWVTGVTLSFVQGNSDKIYTRVCFDKTHKASGYQIGYGNKYKVGQNKIANRKTLKTTKRSYVLKKQVTYVQVRPYRKIQGKTYYGKWSSVYTIGCISKDSKECRACR